MLKDIRIRTNKRTNKINTTTYMWTYQGRNQYGLPGKFNKSNIVSFVTDTTRPNRPFKLARHTYSGRLGVHFTVNTQGRIELTEKGHRLLGGRSGRGSKFMVTTMI